MKSGQIFSSVFSVSLCRSKEPLSKLKLWNAVNRLCHTVELRSVKIPSFGKLRIVNALCDVSVEPIEPHKNFNADIAYIYGNVDLDVKSGEIPKEGLLTLSGGRKGEKTTVQVPVKYDLEARVTGESQISVTGLEANLIKVDSEKGDIILQSVKSEKIVASSTGGNIHCRGVTQGSIQLKTEAGMIRGKRFQGPTVSVTTKSGDVIIDSTYSDQSFYETTSGSLTLRNLHRRATVSILGKGNVNVTGLDGSISAEVAAGNATLQISNLDNNSSVNVGNGSLTVQIPEDPKFTLTAKGQYVNVSPNLESSIVDERVQVGKGHWTFSCLVENGETIIEQKDWFSSLGLKF